jgi:hypothetical protein
MTTHGSPADRGSADAYYHRPMRPHKWVKIDDKWTEHTDLTVQEEGEYIAAYINEDDRKDYGQE